MEEHKQTGEAPDIVTESSAVSTPSPAAQPQGCPGDCKLCTMMQHTYCAAQMSANVQNLIAALVTKVDVLSDELAKMRQSLAETKEPDAPLVNAPEPKKTKKPAK